MSVTMSCVIVTGILRGAFIVKLLYSIAPSIFSSFFFNDTATTEIYTLSLHDALPIYAAHRRPGRRCAGGRDGPGQPRRRGRPGAGGGGGTGGEDRGQRPAGAHRHQTDRERRRRLVRGRAVGRDGQGDATGVHLAGRAGRRPGVRREARSGVEGTVTRAPGPVRGGPRGVPRGRGGVCQARGHAELASLGRRAQRRPAGLARRGAGRLQCDRGGVGAKRFITNGISADLVIVVARTDPGAGSRGISLLVLERGMPGFSRGRKLDKIGLHAQDTAELFFDDARVPAANLLGREGGGFLHLMDRLPLARMSIAMMALASLHAALDWTLQYTSHRTPFAPPIPPFPNTPF